MATATDGIAKIGDGKALLWKHNNGKAWRGFVLQRQGMTLHGKGIATGCFALQRLGITWLGGGMAMRRRVAQRHSIVRHREAEQWHSIVTRRLA
jgi:hypothetical protein